MIDNQTSAPGYQHGDAAMSNCEDRAVRDVAVEALIARARSKSDWTRNDSRRAVLEAAEQGLAEYLPAGARDNDYALVLIDGVDVGPACTLAGSLVRTDTSSGSTYSIRKLLPASEHQRQPETPEGA